MNGDEMTSVRLMSSGFVALALLVAGGCTPPTDGASAAQAAADAAKRQADADLATVQARLQRTEADLAQLKDEEQAAREKAEASAAAKRAADEEAARDQAEQAKAQQEADRVKAEQESAAKAREAEAAANVRAEKEAKLAGVPLEARAFDGTYVGALTVRSKESSQSFVPRWNLEIEGGSGEATDATSICGTSQLSLSVSPQGEINGRYVGYGAAQVYFCDKVTSAVHGHVVGNKLDLQFDRGYGVLVKQGS